MQIHNKYKRRPFRQAKILIISLFTILPFYSLSAQNVEWATEIVKVSSRIKIEGSSWINGKWTKERSPEQVLGKPNKCPASGDSPCAWAGGSDGEYFGGREERITVGYKKAMQIQQVAIAENYNPGAVEQVILYDTKDVAHVVFHGEAAPVKVKSRVMNVSFLKTDYKVKAVEIVLQCGKVPGLNEIDAIGISDSKVPVKAEINVAPESKILSGKENLGRGVNSEFDEVYPLISPDGKTLFFDRKDHPYNIGNRDNIWYSELTPDGKWGVAKNIGTGLNNGYGTFAATITPDGNTLLIGGKFSDNYKQSIWMVRKTASGWGTPSPVHIDSFYTYHKFMEFCLAADEKTLIISLQRDDSYGSRDLYACFLEKDGSWSKPKNLGAEINSGGDEGTPFLAADGKTLYFSSDGYSGYGSLDIFLSRRLDDTWQHWSEPENLGSDLNTPDWDAYFTIPASGDYAYFVSNKNSIGALDISRAKLPPSLQPSPVVLVMGKVIDAKTGKPVEATIHYEILPGGREAGLAHSNPVTGEYKISLPSGEHYGFRAESNGYVAVSQNLDIKKIKQYTEIKRDLKLVPMEVGQTVRLNNLFFDFNKSTIQSSSFAELDRLVELLKASPKMEVEISGHTDNVGNDATNKKLSNDRAKAVRDYLVSKSISSGRLKTIGYGKSKPLASNDTEEGRAQNRRVEFTILKE
jgi:OOP family OmpA-OmpF porin